MCILIPHTIILILFLILPALTEAKIRIDITTGSNNSDISIEYSGSDFKMADDSDLSLFKLQNSVLNEAVKRHFGKKPTNIYLKSPTPWGDLYKLYHWEQISKIITVESAKLKAINKKPVIILSHDFDNSSNNTIKVNTGITQSVENTISTSWSKNYESTISQDIQYDINVIFAKISGTTGFSYTSSFGKSEERSQAITIGTNSGFETELKPNQSITATLTANRGILEAEIIYLSKLRGNVAVNFKRKHKDHHFWGPQIEDVMKDSNIENAVRVKETVNICFYTDASLVVFDKSTGLPL